MEGAINLVPREMCAECDALLGKEHRIGCSKTGTVSTTHAVEKFTTVERVDQEDPLLGIDADTAELLLRSLVPPEVAGEDGEKLVALREGLEGFVKAARELEGNDVTK